jgi:RNA polymerase sigma factor (sigma-70 family)
VPYLKRRLTDEQRALAEAALAFVDVGVRAFARRHPSYRRLIPACDMKSAAEMAVVEASFSYDPTRSKPTTYYGTAIRHALLKEVRRYQRSREGAHERVPLEKALRLSASLDLRQQALACLNLLPEEDRALIEAHVIEGRSLRSLGREAGRDWRTIKARLRRACATMRAFVADYSGRPSDTPSHEPPGQA